MIYAVVGRGGKSGGTGFAGETLALRRRHVHHDDVEIEWLQVIS